MSRNIKSIYSSKATKQNILYSVCIHKQIFLLCRQESLTVSYGRRHLYCNMNDVWYIKRSWDKYLHNLQFRSETRCTKETINGNKRWKIVRIFIGWVLLCPQLLVLYIQLYFQIIALRALETIFHHALLCKMIYKHGIAEWKRSWWCKGCKLIHWNWVADNHMIIHIQRFDKVCLLFPVVFGSILESHNCRNLSIWEV